MNLKVETTSLKGLLLITPRAFQDKRGSLAETYQMEDLKKFGINFSFTQENQTYSRRGVLRGLHAQHKRPQAKLVRAIKGEIFDVAVDARPHSPTFGKWHGDHLSGDNLKQLYVPEGFLHGFYVLSRSAVVLYKCSRTYDPGDQVGILWNDPNLNIKWKVKKPILSPKDLANGSWENYQQTLRAGKAGRHG